MSQLLNDTLSAWLLIESLSPGEVNFTAEDILFRIFLMIIQIFIIQMGHTVMVTHLI